MVLEAVLFHTLSPSKTVFFLPRKLMVHTEEKLWFWQSMYYLHFFAVFEKKFIILVPKYCPSHKINWSKEKWCEGIEKFIQLLLKVRKSRKQFMVSSILPKNERKNDKIQPITYLILSTVVDFFVHFLGEMKTP